MGLSSSKQTENGANIASYLHAQPMQPSSTTRPQPIYSSNPGHIGSELDSLSNRLGGLSLTGSAASSSLATSSITLLSHAHGRQRREERGIEKRELQEAIKYGRKERANPGRDGKPRWRFTHKNVVYVTDETCRHEITSWRLDDALDAAPAAVDAAADGGVVAHVVMVVDMSGSMRKEDVPGYACRSQAVYNCLAKDLVEPQVKNGNTAGVEVSLIEMSDTSRVLLRRVAMDQGLLDFLNRRASARARSHGNYLPALDEAIQLLSGDAHRQSQLFLVFLSDGAPSDHTQLQCEHGYCVWQDTPGGFVDARGRRVLVECGHKGQTAQCRLQLRQSVELDCVKKVQHLGDLLGRDRVRIHTVAFGPPNENYTVLQTMAHALPRSSFQKLGLSAANLRTAFTSLTSTITSVCTELGGARLTPRLDIASTRSARKVYEQSHYMNPVEWDIYVGAHACLAKQRYDVTRQHQVDSPYFDAGDLPWARNADRGVAISKNWFSAGAERVAFQCTEVFSWDGGKSAVSVGPQLVAKQSRFKEPLRNQQYHRTFLRTQGEAEELAVLFNRRLAGGAHWQVHFLPCWLYKVRDWRYEGGTTEVLVEEELTGAFTKWNNNAGGVAKGLRCGLGDRAGAGGGSLLAIAEEDEEEEDDSDDEGGGAFPQGGTTADVPQCFSHFTYVATNGKKLVCDLQGVWNATDGFTFTDPVIHHHSGSKHNGATDKGPTGMRTFFRTHVCNALCRRLGLEAVRL